MGNTLHALLGEKPYHNIGHLPGSRVGPGDHTIDPGTAALFTDPAKWRGPQERIIVQEKLDGSCVCIMRYSNEIIPALRSGHRAETSPYEQHHRFAVWVRQRDREYGTFSRMLKNGERICGEWCAQAHGILYDCLPALFFAFDIRSDGQWLPALAVMRRCQEELVRVVPLLYVGPPIALEHVKRLTNRSAFRTKGPAEGVVLRREFGGRRTDIAKWVRQDHRPGLYLQDVAGSTGGAAMWQEVVWDG